MLSISQSNFLQALGWAVVNSIWQMAMLWLIYKTYVFFFKPNSATKSKLSFLVLVTGTVWFFAGFIIALNSSLLLHFSSGFAVPAMLKDSIAKWLPLASIVYLSLLAVPVIRLIINIRQVSVIRKQRLKKIEVQWRIFVKKMSAYLELRRPVQVWISENITSPVTIGFIKPVILVPLAAINHLDIRQMEAVLLHELAHIKRNDYLINIITHFIKTIFYFNPFVRSIASTIDEEREKSCDECVLQYQYDAYAYSTALLQLEKLRLSTIKLAMAASSGRDRLLERVKKIMGISRTPVYSFKESFGQIAGVALSAVLFAVIFSNTVNTEAPELQSAVFPVAFLQDKPLADLSPEKKQTAFVKSHTSTQPKTNPKTNTATPDPAYPEDLTTSFVPVNFIEVQDVPELDEASEEQVKEAVAASKKILKEIKMKEVEKTAADALNNYEKQVLKNNYDRQLAKADWDKLENQLRLSYDKINWDKLNGKINEALNEIRIDSITAVYNKVLASLAAAKKELVAGGLKGIPDTEITLAEMETAKAKIETSLNKLKAVKEKKIIRL